MFPLKRFLLPNNLQDTIINRIIYRMKVTALLPDQLALEEWLRLKKIAQLNEQVHQQPLEFSKGFSAASTRKLNRRS